LFEVFSMNSYECISMVNATNGIKSHHRNDNILNTLVIIKVVTFNKLPSFWKVIECVVYIFQIGCFKIFKSSNLWNSRPLGAIWWNYSIVNKFAYLLVDLLKLIDLLTLGVGSLTMATTLPTIDFWHSLHLLCLWF
jgi:hypothetical protein